MVKSVAPLAHASPTNMNAKAAGPKGLAAALLAVAHKGAPKTANASGAASDTKSGTLGMAAFAEILKKGLAEGAMAKDALSLLKRATATEGAATAAAVPAFSGNKEQVGKDEKADQKKKAPAAVALSVALTGAQPGNALSPKAGAPSDQKMDLSQQASVTSKPAVAHETQPVLRIVDLRTSASRRGAAAPAGDDSAAASKSAGTAATDAKDQGVSFMQRLSNASGSSATVAEKPAPASSAQAQTPLERLRDMAGSELTQATNLILKDGGGEIRLLLKPESLGSVRIRMNVVDNKIEGTIIVDSAAVKHVFDGSVDALRRALTAEGFQTGSLSVSVGGQGTDPGDRQQRQAPAAVQRVAAKGFESTIPGVETMSLGDLFVNFFA